MQTKGEKRENWKRENGKRDASISSATGEERREKTGREKRGNSKRENGKRDASTSSATGEERREKTGREMLQQAQQPENRGKSKERKIEEYNKNHFTSRCLRLSKAAGKKRDASTSSATGE